MTCTELRCVSDTYCEKPGTYQHDYPGLRNVRFNMICCDTNLCINFEKEPETLNSKTESLVQSLNEICFYSLFCIIGFVLFIFFLVLKVF